MSNNVNFNVYYGFLMLCNDQIFVWKFILSTWGNQNFYFSTYIANFGDIYWKVFIQNKFY